MKIAITWSTWFIWSYLVKFFSNKWWDVIAFWRKKYTNIFDNYENVEYISWDINNRYNWYLKWIDVFIHSAANLDYENNKNILIKDNVDSLINIHEITKNIKDFIYISSSSVYQWMSWLLSIDYKIDEKNLVNSYSLTKYLAEKYIFKNFKNNVIILRPRAVYWKGDRVLVPNILKNQLFKKLILPWNWKVKTSVTDINDFVEKTFFIIQNKEYWIHNIFTKVDTHENLFLQIVKDYNLKWIIKIPIWVFKLLTIINKNKFSYIVDTFWNDKILR